MSNAGDNLPRKVQVKALVSSRYDALYASHELLCGERPASWDDRVSGADVIATENDVKITLQSDGQQSPPVPGQTLMLRSGDDAQGYTWTLYGIRS
ncbi:MAG: hypothetical protein KDD62_08495 [Bdellovibrionales bacterium]|nr:hypothetical protein [Bdellovibrionales bacterium]